MTGAPVTMVDTVPAKQLGAADYAVSASGSLVYISGGIDRRWTQQLVWVDRNGRESNLAVARSRYEVPRLSPDGSRAAVGVVGADGMDIWVYDVNTEVFGQLTVHRAEDRYPAWTPDGQELIFQSTRDGGRNLYVASADGSGTVERRTTTGRIQWPYEFLLDGEELLIGSALTGRQREIDILRFEGAEPAMELIRNDFLKLNPDVSPDGRWLAYSSNRTGRMEVYVVPFEDVDGARVQVSRAGGWSPVWSEDGSELFYRADETFEMMVAAVVTAERFSVTSAPAVLFSGDYVPDSIGYPRPWDVRGDRFLMIKRGANAETVSEISYVQHWHQELSDRVPVD